MTVLDTDTLTHLLTSNPRATERFRHETDDVFISVITRIEVLQGRFATLLKAADAAELLRGQARLDQADRDLRPFRVLPVTDSAAQEFDRLRQNKKLKKIGRADLLIAAIVLANQATLVTRNLKDFRQVPGLQVENWLD
jgi:tRNA(fMet)-specific endonuclease VapC